MKTVKQKLDEGWYIQSLLSGNSNEFVRREILIDIISEFNEKNLKEQPTLYAMFIYGEVIRQEITHQTHATMPQKQKDDRLYQKEIQSD